MRYKLLATEPAIYSNPIRSYLIQRPEDKTDPDPKFPTVIFHIWPLMLLATLAHLTLLTCIAGLIGPYIFPALAICFFVDLTALLLNWRLFCNEQPKTKETAKKRDSGSYDPEKNQENIELQSNIEQNTTSTDEEMTFKLSDLVIAALCSTWLPSVVGDQKQKIFLVSGMASLITKVLILAIAVALAASGDEVQEQIYKRPFLLYCVEKNSSLLTEEGVTQCTGLISDCFANNNETLANEIKLRDAFGKLTEAVLAYQTVVSDINKRDDQSSEQGHIHSFLASGLLRQIKQTKVEWDELDTFTGAQRLQQKLRVCQEGEGLFRIGLLLGLLVVIALAACSTYRLHKIADYKVCEIK